MSLLRDERGSLSTARCAFWLTLIVSLVLVVLSAAGMVELVAADYTLLGSLVTCLAVWAAGPRMAQYMAPWLGRVADALSRAKTDPRLPDIRMDDER